MTFKEKVLCYINLQNSTFAFIPEFDKVVVDAVNLLGIDRIEKMNYHKGHIEEALIAKSNISEANKIMKLLVKAGFTMGVTKTNSEIKSILSGIYQQLGIKKAATATQISNYFEAKPVKVTVNNKRENGYKIIKSLIVFK